MHTEVIRLQMDLTDLPIYAFNKINTFKLSSKDFLRLMYF